MIVWITSQSIPVIALVVLAWCYLMSAVIGAIVAWAARRGHVAALTAISPVTLTPLAVVFGLFFGFLAADVWSSFEHARTVVTQEALGLQQAVFIADALPPETRALVRGAVREHIRRAVHEEWPTMAAGSETLRNTALPMLEAMTAVLALDLAHAGQRLVQEHALAAIERAIEARWLRIVISQRSVGIVRWLAIMVLAGLIQATIAMVHVDNPRTLVITMFIFATAVAMSMLVIMVYDRPFGSGGVLLLPTVLQDVMPN